MSRRSIIHVHADEEQRQPVVFMGSSPTVFVDIPAAALVLECFEHDEKAIRVRAASDPKARLYLSIESAVRMATDILATTMGVTSTPDQGAA